MWTATSHFTEIQNPLISEAVLRRISSKSLCRTRDGSQLGTSGQLRPPETAFQNDSTDYFGMNSPE